MRRIVAAVAEDGILELRGVVLMRTEPQALVREYPSRRVVFMSLSGAKVFADAETYRLARDGARSRWMAELLEDDDLAASTDLWRDDVRQAAALREDAEDAWLAKEGT